MVGRCGRLKAVLQGLCPVGNRTGNVVLARLQAVPAHHQGTLMARRCTWLRQIGAALAIRIWIQKR